MTDTRALQLHQVEAEFNLTADDLRDLGIQPIPKLRRKVKVKYYAKQIEKRLDEITGVATNVSQGDVDWNKVLIDRLQDGQRAN